MRARHIIYLVLFVLILVCSCREKNNASSSLGLKGCFSMSGSSPFTKLIFRSGDGIDYEVAPPEAGKYVRMQGVKIEIRGDVSSHEMETADGKYRRKFYTIKNINIIQNRY